MATLHRACMSNRVGMPRLNLTCSDHTCIAKKINPAGTRLHCRSMHLSSSETHFTELIFEPVALDSEITDWLFKLLGIRCIFFSAEHKLSWAGQTRSHARDPNGASDLPPELQVAAGIRPEVERGLDESHQDDAEPLVRASMRRRRVDQRLVRRHGHRHRKFGQKWKRCRRRRRWWWRT